jgi:hypothetical protein
MEKAIQNLSELGKRLKESEEVKDNIELAAGKNPWFTEQFVQHALDAVVNEMLNKQKLKEWLTRYELKPVNKTIGLIFAGNLPLVGFHDFLCCYVAGCKMKIKLSSKDDSLFPFIIRMLSSIDSELVNRIEFVETLKDYDAVIATGSNNTHRYFEYYFRNHPKILRKNRNSVAILTADETKDDLEKLADDIFLYFGFGCRNVSKLYVPVDYDFAKLFPHFEKYKWLHQHTKYMNNYDYNRTILLLNKTPHLSNDFVMIRENVSIPSPISVLHYEYWHDEKILNSHLKQQHEKIQCVVSNHPEQWNFSSSFQFGEAQHPALWDYADGIDTLNFLLSL